LSVLYLVDMNARLEKNVSTSNANTLAVGKAFDDIGFGLPVTPHRDHFEADNHAQPIPVGVGCWKIAKNSAPDLPVFGIHRNGFRYINGAIGIHLRGTGELLNALFRLNRGVKDSKREERKKEGAHCSKLFLEVDFWHFAGRRIADLKKLGGGELEEAGDEVAGK